MWLDNTSVAQATPQRMQIDVEKVFTKGTKFIEKRESLWIEKLEAEFKGLNKLQ